MLKQLPTVQSCATFLLAASLILPAASIRTIRAADASAPIAKSGNPCIVTMQGADTAEAEFRVGASGKIAVTFKFADGKTQSLRGVVKADTLQRTVEKDGKKTPETVPMADGFIEFAGAGLSFQYHSRPCLVRYKEVQQANLAKVWGSLPAASQCWVPLEVRADAAGAELWMDGRYSGRVPGESRLTEVSFALEAGGDVRGVRALTRTDSGMYLPLDVRHIARPGAMKESRVSLKPGRQMVKGVPFDVVDGAGNADVGEAKMMQGPRLLETNQFTSRTSLDGMQESLHFSVPQAYYRRAWVLCAVEADGKKDPVLTTRLTRFAVAGRGGAIADTTITLPRGKEKPRAGIEQVGSVAYVTADKKKTTTPLYLVPVELKLGEIVDLLADAKDPEAAMKIGPYLDFEFLGKMDVQNFQVDRRRMPLDTSTSGVHVFGVTLEKSPVELRLKQSQPGNIFHNDEVPETTLSLRAVQPTKCVLRWEISDVKGAKLAAQQKTVSLDAVGSESQVTLALAMPQAGWYGLQITVNDEQGAALLQHDAAFALLGKDTRTAGYESPFGTWWNAGQHYTTHDAAIAGPLLLKAGMRRTTTLWDWVEYSEADLAPWKLSLNQVPWLFSAADLKNWPAAETRVEKKIAGLVKRFPHCQYALLFHESYGSGLYPPELYGEKFVAKDVAQTKQEDELYELGLRAAKFLRAKFPQLKIIAGNSWGSLGITAVLLRRGFPRELIDYFGTEILELTGAPERLDPYGGGSIWMLGETARQFGYDKPLTSCFEFCCRSDRDLDPQRQAEWYARDVMMCLAHRFPTISPGCLEDVGNAYYDSSFGATGLCQRNPLHYPKPAYVALATLTKALDSAKLTRQLDTGSSSAHALEFTRGDERVYAVWTLRGECQMQVELPADNTLTLTDFYGAQRKQASSDKRLTLTASSAVSYFASPVAVKSITAGARHFPQQSPPPDVQIVARMNKLADWQIVPDDTPLTTRLRRPGKFTLSQRKDAEQGLCLEVALQQEGVLPAVIAEYTALKLNNPAPIRGRPHSIGMWVKGDSSWGRIMWEIEDVQGERFRSSGGWDGGDWGNYSALDFDGWCFMGFPLTDDSPFTHIEPGSGQKLFGISGQWQSTGDGHLDYPLMLTGIYVITHRQSLSLTKMMPVTKPLRFKNVSVIAGAIQHSSAPAQPLVVAASGTTQPTHVGGEKAPRPAVAPLDTAQTTAAAADTAAKGNSQQSLFNGRNLDGWSPQGYKGWSVANGAIVGTPAGQRGWLMTDAEYDNYEVVLEYKLGAEANSGVFLGAQPGAAINGSDFCEVQLLDDTAARYTNVPANERNAAVLKRIAPSKTPTTPAGQWHRLRIACFGNHLRVELNGGTVIDSDVSEKKLQGHIGLQLYPPAPVEFRNISLLPLDPDGLPLGAQKATTPVRAPARKK